MALTKQCQTAFLITPIHTKVYCQVLQRVFVRGGGREGRDHMHMHHSTVSPFWKTQARQSFVMVLWKLHAHTGSNPTLDIFMVLGFNESKTRT